MGALRPRWWEAPLESLNHEEWEALCDGCGRCCLVKLEDEDTGEVIETNVACRLLDTGTARCSDYRNRKAFVPDCLRLTPHLVRQVAWLPQSCAYRRRAEGLPLPPWHPLLAGSRAPMLAAGACVAGQCISETLAGPIEQHVLEEGWPSDQALPAPAPEPPPPARRRARQAQREER